MHGRLSYGRTRRERETRATLRERRGIYRTPKSDARCLGGSPLLSVPLWTQQGTLRVFHPHRTTHPGRRRLSSRCCYLRCHWGRYCVYFPKTRNTVVRKWRKIDDWSLTIVVYSASHLKKSVIIRTWQMYLYAGSWCYTWNVRSLVNRNRMGLVLTWKYEYYEIWILRKLRIDSSVRLVILEWSVLWPVYFLCQIHVFALFNYSSKISRSLR